MVEETMYSEGEGKGDGEGQLVAPFQPPHSFSETLVFSAPPPSRSFSSVPLSLVRLAVWLTPSLLAVGH